MFTESSCHWSNKHPTRDYVEGGLACHSKRSRHKYMTVSKFGSSKSSRESTQKHQNFWAHLLHINNSKAVYTSATPLSHLNTQQRSRTADHKSRKYNNVNHSKQPQIIFTVRPFSESGPSSRWGQEHQHPHVTSRTIPTCPPNRLTFESHMIRLKMQPQDPLSERV